MAKSVGKWQKAWEILKYLANFGEVSVPVLGITNGYNITQNV